MQSSERDAPGIAGGKARRRNADADLLLDALDSARRTMPEYIDAPSISTAMPEPDRKRRGRGPSTARTASATKTTAAAAVADQVKPTQHFAEDRASEHPAVGQLAQGNDVEDGRRRDGAKGEQSANPDGDGQDRGEPKRKHSHHYN